MAQNICTIAQVRQIERRVFLRAPSFEVMTAAARAVAAAAKQLAPRGAILAVAGGGNNGGDAFVAAQLLKTGGRRVVVCAPPLKSGKDNAPADAARARALWEKSGGQTIAPAQWQAEKGREKFALVMDGLLGVGFKKPPMRADIAALAKKINAARARGAKVLAVDIPSGVDADSGLADADAVRADLTITFFTAKPGLVTGEGKECAGVLKVDDLGAKKEIAEAGGGQMLTAVLRAKNFARAANAHKGDCGALLIAGGAAGMSGAAALAARAAVRIGAGKVFVLPPQKPPPLFFDPLCPEAMWRGAWPEAFQVFAAGMGLGQSAAAQKMLARLLKADIPAALDADALNLIAARAPLRRLLKNRRAPAALTPHPGEAARLCAALKIRRQSRPQTALALAKELNAAVALKGAGTIIAAPSGNWRLCARGNAGLAQAGAGDVLSGILGGLMARRFARGYKHQSSDEMFFTLANAVFLHGAAADVLAKAHGAPGIALGDIGEQAQRILNKAAGEK